MPKLEWKARAQAAEDTLKDQRIIELSASFMMGLALCDDPMMTEHYRMQLSQKLNCIKVRALSKGIISGLLRMEVFESELNRLCSDVEAILDGKPTFDERQAQRMHEIKLNRFRQMADELNIDISTLTLV